MRAVLAAVLLTAAAADPAPPPVEVQAGRIEVKGVGLTSADLVLHLVVANHTGAPLTLRTLDYEAVVDGAPFTRGRVEGPVSLPAGRAVGLALPATVGYGEAGGQVLAILRKGEVPFRVTGSVRVEGASGSRVERFDQTGVIGVSGARTSGQFAPTTKRERSRASESRPVYPARLTLPSMSVSSTAG